MWLVVVVIALIVWAIYEIINLLTPPAPPIEDLDEHLRIITSMNSQDERRKYLKNRRKGK